MKIKIIHLNTYSGTHYCWRESDFRSFVAVPCCAVEGKNFECYLLNKWSRLNSRHGLILALIQYE